MSGLLKKDHDSEEHMATKPNVEEYYRDDPAKLKQELEKKEKLVQSALQHRFKKMEAEEIKLRQIRSTLKSLSVDTGKEIPAFFAFRFLRALATFFFNSLADSLRLLASSLFVRLQCLLKKFKSCNCSLVNSGGTDSVLKGDGVSHII